MARRSDGPRRVLVRIVLWWSFFTAATGWVWNATSLVVTRTLFGAGEAGCFPNLTRVLTIWLPVGERERAQGFLWFAARWSGAFTPILVALVLDYVTWRRAFELFGLVGVVWCDLLLPVVPRRSRATHPGVNAAEAALLPSAAQTAVGATIPWRRLATNRSVWLLCIQYGCLAYGWWFYVTWLPTYLREARGTGVKFGAILAGLPLLLGGLGCLVSGWMLPRIARALGSVAKARRLVALVGFAGASGSIFVFTRIADPVTAMLVLGLAGFFNDFVMPAAWAGCMDIGGRYAGTVSGAMNTFGSVAGALSAADRRVHPDLDRSGLDADVLRLLRDLSRRRPLLVVPRCTHAVGRSSQLTTVDQFTVHGSQFRVHGSDGSQTCSRYVSVGWQGCADHRRRARAWQDDGDGARGGGGRRRARRPIARDVRIGGARRSRRRPAGRYVPFRRTSRPGPT